MRLFLIKFTQDKGKTDQELGIPAKSLVDAYIEIQLRFPKAEITELRDSGKMLTFGTSNWLDILAKHLVDHATVEQVREAAELCDSDMREELTDAIWKLKKSK